jgi:hypothetical protein
MSHREQIMAHLLTAVQAINGPPTYTNTVTPNMLLTRDPVNLAEVARGHQVPAAILEEHEQIVNSHFEQDSTFVPSALSFSRLHVVILALVVKRGGVNTALNAWLEDLLKAIIVDTTRGGAAIDTVFTSVSAPREDRAVPDNLAGAEMRFSVMYSDQHNQL